MKRGDVAQILALVVFLIATPAVASYILRIPSLPAWARPPMSLTTGICMMLLSICVALLAHRKD